MPIFSIALAILLERVSYRQAVLRAIVKQFNGRLELKVEYTFNDTM